MFRETFITRFIVRGRGNESKSRRKRRTEESEILLEKREKESFGKNHIALSSDWALQRKLQQQTARSPRRDSLTKTSTDSRPYTHHRQPLSAARSTSSPREKSPQRDGRLLRDHKEAAVSHGCYLMCGALAPSSQRNSGSGGIGGEEN